MIIDFKKLKSLLDEARIRTSPRKAAQSGKKSDDILRPPMFKVEKRKFPAKNLSSPVRIAATAQGGNLTPESQSGRREALLHQSQTLKLASEALALHQAAVEKELYGLPASAIEDSEKADKTENTEIGKDEL